MIDFIKNIFRPKLIPLNYITIKKDNILNNIKVIKKLQKGNELFPVIKSNGYGHGLKEICSILKDSDIDMVCIDSYVEYPFVKKYFSKKILVLGETNRLNYKYYDFIKTSFCVYNISTLKHLISLNKKIKIHLFLNTGMNREGIQENNLKEFLKVLKKTKIVLEGVCSHLSSADDLNMCEINNQINNFKELYKYIESNNFNPKYRHISASAGSLKVDDPFFNAARPGIAFYGYNQLSKKDKHYKKGEKLKPALDLYSTVVSTQKVEFGDGVSYNLTYKFKNKSNIFTIPFGYNEGLDRRLSNNFQIKINNNYYPLRGRVCMNLSSFEDDLGEIKIGDKIHLISSKKSDKNSIENIAKSIGSIDWDVLVGIDGTIRRRVV